MNRWHQMVLFILSLVWSSSTMAQEIEMADAMRSNGKIYVVVAVIVIIFTGLLVYLLSIDSRLKKLERAKK